MRALVSQDDELTQGPWWRRWQEVSWLLIVVVVVVALAVGLGRRHLQISAQAGLGPDATLLLPAGSATGVDRGRDIGAVGGQLVSTTPSGTEGSLPRPDSAGPSSSSSTSESSTSTSGESVTLISAASTTSLSVRPVASMTTSVGATAVRDSTTSPRWISETTTTVVTATTSASTTTTAPTTTTTSTSTSTTTVPTTTTTQWLGPVPRSDRIAGKDDKDLKVNVLDNDLAGSAPLDEDSLTIVVPPAHADSYRVHGDHVHYRSVKDFSGLDQLQYRICDEDGRCAQATVVFDIS